LTSKISLAMSLLVSIPILIVFLYVTIIALYSFKLSQIKNPGRGKPKGTRRVSLVIPFRNEGKNLGGLVQDLLAQSYPADLFQVIFVDDHSEDDSMLILESLIANRAGFSCLSLPVNKHGKKEALCTGIEKVENDWIIQVDADCRIGERFIASHMTHLKKHPSDLVAGLVTTNKNSNRFMETFERMDLLSLSGVGAASFFYKRPMMCSGANLAFSKDLYNQTRLYDPSESVASGDDMFLMIGARKLGRSLSFNLATDSLVSTTPVSKLPCYLKQRVRWGAKTPYYRQWDIQFLAILVVLTNVAVLIYPVWALTFPGTWPWLLGIWVVKTFIDGSLIFRTAGFTKQKLSIKWFLLASIVYYPVFLMILIKSLSGQSVWKERIPK
jgi:biofilm PGA synthesis N-glycosyltransferase PgaC